MINEKTIELDKKEKARIYHHEWYKKKYVGNFRDKCLVDSRKWREDNPDFTKNRNAEFRRIHKERLNQKSYIFIILRIRSLF